MADTQQTDAYGNPLPQQQARPNPLATAGSGALAGGLNYGAAQALTGGGSGAGSAATSGAYQLPTQLGMNGPTATPASSGALGGAGPALGVAGIGALTAQQAYDAYHRGQHQGLGGGLSAGFKSPLSAVPVLGQAAWAGGALGGLTGGTQDPEQLKRMAVKKVMDQMGLGSNLEWQGAGGNTVNLRDAQYNTDNSNPLMEQAIGWTNPFAHYIVSQLGDPGHAKVSAQQLAAEMANAVTNGATDINQVKNNVLGFAKQLGLQPAQMREAFDSMMKGNMLNQGEVNAFNAAMTNLISGQGAQTPPTAQQLQQAQQPQQGGAPPGRPVAPVGMSPKGTPAPMQVR